MLTTTVVALTLVFADGYMGGAVHAQDFKDKASCERKGSQMVVEYTGYGHPASYTCTAVKRERRADTKPAVTHLNLPTLSTGEPISTKP